MNDSVNSPVPKDEEVHLLDHLLLLAKHSRVIIYTTLAISVLTLVILLIIPNKYTAVARLLPPQQNMTLSAQLLDSLGGAAIPGAASGTRGLGDISALLGVKAPGPIYVSMMSGNNFSDRIIERFKLRELYNKDYIEEVRKKLSERVELLAGEKEGIISIEVTDEDPQRAADMANAYVEELDKLLQKLAVQEAKERLTFLEKQLNQTSINLAKAEESLRAFGEKSGVLQIDAQTKGVIEYVATLRAAIDAKEVELEVLRKQATPLNYDVVRAETELKGLKEKLKTAESQGTGNPGLGDVLIATAKVPALGLEYMRLFRVAKYQEGLYQLYVKLAELARLDEVRNASVLQIVDRAVPPEKKSHPKRLLITGLVGGATFIIMIFAAYLREYWQNILVKGESEARYLEQFRLYGQHWRQDLGRLRFWRKR